MALDPPPSSAAVTADEAIACVLRQERAAHQAIEAAQVQALHLAETARAEARATAARAERRSRRITEAFERVAQARTAALDTQAAAMAQAHVPTAADQARVAHAVQWLAAELTGGRR